MSSQMTLFRQIWTLSYRCKNALLHCSWTKPLAAASTAFNACNKTLFQRNFSTNLKVHRFTGTIPVKTHAPKTQSYLQAEKDFLAEREIIPNGYITGFEEDELQKLTPTFRSLLHLRCASNKEIQKRRILILRRTFQKQPFDTGSPAVKIAILTEKILSLRSHCIRFPKDHDCRRVMSIRLGTRKKLMKYLYQTDYELYKHVCETLGIKCISFAIPDSRDRARAINLVAVDGERCRFLIRQKLWKARFRPRPIRFPDGQTVRYTRHPIEITPPGWNIPQKHEQKVSEAWPYGVREERLEGSYVIPNPTAPGLGYCPVPMLF